MQVKPFRMQPGKFFMIMNTPTHQAITKRAQQLWKDYGSPGDRDQEIWLEAEKQIAVGSSETQTGAIVAPAKTTLGESQSQAAIAEKAAQQKKEAGAPILPTKDSPREPTPETGKPLYDRPHSS